MSRVSRNDTPTREPRPLTKSGWGVLLRAVSADIKAAEMLYASADLLTKGRNATDRAYNRAVVDLTTRLLDLPTDPEVMEHVLRNLPDYDAPKESK